MSAGGARRGRRDNGLDAKDFAIAGDVDPRVGEHLLDVLAAGGIAAYLQPSADLNPVTRTTTVPPRPVDRLYVDRVHLSTARDYLAQLADEAPPVAAPPEQPDDRHIDAEWERIVAGYHASPADDQRPWPAVEDVPAVEEVPADPTADPRPPAGGSAPSGVRQLPSATDFTGISVRGPRADEPSLLDGLDTFGADLPGGPEEEYTPPPPPPLPRLSKHAVVGILAVVGGFLLFVFPSLLPVDRMLATLLGFTGIVGGFGMLISRLRVGDEDDDLDDGAVV